MIRTHSLLPALCGLLLFSACDDPSNVGIGLVGEQGEPVVVTLETSLFEEAPLEDITGGTVRALAGRVEDPLVGTITATGYLDFAESLPADARDDVITGVTLSLRRDYVYGDTTSTLSFSLREVVGAWSEIGAPADTTLPTGDVIATFSLTASDTLVEVPLPAAWLAANLDSLRSADFGNRFDGFALEPAAGNAVAGFQRTASKLVVYTDKDTVDLNINEVLSGLVRTGAPVLPEGVHLVQDGTGPTVKLNFELGVDSLRNTPVNRVVVYAYADTLLAQQTPPGFVRPALGRVQLVRLTASGQASILAEASVKDGMLRFTSLTLRNFVQGVLLGQNPYDHLELRAPFLTDGNATVPASNTLNVVFVHDPSAAATSPGAELTISPGQ